MAVLGLILLVVAGVLTAAVVTSNTDSLAVSLWSVDVSNVTLGIVFVAGMITTVLAVVGLGLLMGGMRRNRRLRRERRTLQRENEQLAQRMDTTPAAPTATHREEREYADDRPVTEDRTTVLPPASMGPGYDGDATEGSTPTQPGGSFVPRREERPTTETVSRDV